MTGKSVAFMHDKVGDLHFKGNIYCYDKNRKHCNVEIVIYCKPKLFLRQETCNN